MASSIAAQRVKRELKEVMRSDEVAQCGIKVELVGESLTELKGEIAGPPDTPYVGGVFDLEIKIPEGYPFKPPNVRFVSKIWHPNISSVTGTICLDILKDKWAAAMTLRTVLLSVQSLMASPEPDDPQDAVVAKQYRDSAETFKTTARYWTSRYAKGPPADDECTRKIQTLVDLGVEQERACVALSSFDWNVERATDQLFN